LIPFADAIVTYYNLHWPRGEDGKIRLAPTQSLETYQKIAVNPTPDIAGLKSVLPRLLKLPAGMTSAEQRSAWSKELADLPAIPIGKTADGKLPPFGKGDPDGTPTILPAESYGKTSNAENPELYVVFPYRLYGVGKARSKSRSKYVRRSALSVGRVLGSGWPAIRCAGIDCRGEKGRHRRIHRLWR
jgi:alpha-L-fucosidase 2